MIRPATADDTPRIVAMGSRFLVSSRYGAWLPSTLEQVEAFVATVNALGVIFVAEVPSSSDLAGMLAVVQVQHPMTGELYAEEIAWWVEPAHRGHCGRKLHRAAENWARGRALKYLLMLSPAGSGLGVYYARLGYTEVETSWMKRL